MTLISESAAVQRLRRVLRSKNLVLKTARYGSQIYSYMGRHSVWDFYRNLPVDTHCDIEELARNWGVLGPHEEIWVRPEIQSE